MKPRKVKGRAKMKKTEGQKQKKEALETKRNEKSEARDEDNEKML